MPGRFGPRLIRCGVGCSGAVARRTLKFVLWMGFGGARRIAKLDNGNGVENGAGKTLGSTLSRPPAEARSWPVPFRMTMGSEGAGSYDDQKQESNNPRYTIKDAHGDSRVITPFRFAGWIIGHIGRIAAAFYGCDDGTGGCFCGVPGALCFVASCHRPYIMIIDIAARDVAIITLYAIK